MGSIVGRAGYYIKELREDSGAFIKAYQECLRGSTERVLLVKGDTDSIIKCLTKLYSKSTSRSTMVQEHFFLFCIFGLEYLYLNDAANIETLRLLHK